ncbi:MAG TPA: hypothetical protein VD931_19145 [Baekduia sp.]|nr:hypothetical protein [Baekduia sp.]
MRRLFPALTAGLAAALAGCGGGPDYVHDRDGVLRLDLTEYRLDPQDLTVRAGRIRVIATNKGRLTHNVAVQEIKEEEGDQPTEYARTDTAQPGDRVALNVTLGPGKYQLLCTIGNHDDLGQYGELKVTGEERR